MKQILYLIFLILISCNNRELTYEVNGQSLYLNIDNKGETIHWNKSFITILRFENINIDGLSFEGPNAKCKFLSNDEVEIQMLSKRELASDEESKGGYIKFKVGFDGKDKKREMHTFMIKVE